MVREARSRKIGSHKANEPETRESRWCTTLPVQVQEPENQKSQWYKFRSEAKSKGRRRLMSQLKDSEAEGANACPQPFVPFRTSVYWMKPPKLWRAIFWTLPAYPMLISSRDPA